MAQSSIKRFIKKLSMEHAHTVYIGGVYQVKVAKLGVRAFSITNEKTAYTLDSSCVDNVTEADGVFSFVYKTGAVLQLSLNPTKAEE